MESHKKIYGLMVLASFFWAGAFIAAKLSVPYIPTFSLTFLRFFIAVLVMIPIIRIYRRNGEGVSLTKERIPIFLFTGIVGILGYHVLFFLASKYTTATNASIIGAMNPICTVILGALFAKQKISRRMLAGILISFVGVTLTITGGNSSAFQELSLNGGVLLMLAAVVMWAAYSVFSKCKGQGIPPLFLTYYSFLFCTVFLIPFVIFERPWEWIGSVPASAFAAVGYMSVFASVIGYLVQQVAISEIGPERSSIFINLVPVFSIALAVLILKEPLAPVKLLTAGIIICGVVLCQTGGEKKRS